MRSTNTSGVCGVNWDKRYGKWRATIMYAGKTRHLGYFIDMTEAVSARAAAEVEFGFHKNHGLA